MNHEDAATSECSGEQIDCNFIDVQYPAPTRFVSKRSSSAASVGKRSITGCEDESLKMALEAHRAAIGRMLKQKDSDCFVSTACSLKDRIDDVFNVDVN
jgi:hypothetical protein